MTPVTVPSGNGFARQLFSIRCVPTHKCYFPREMSLIRLYLYVYKTQKFIFFPNTTRIRASRFGNLSIKTYTTKHIRLYNIVIIENFRPVVEFLRLLMWRRVLNLFEKSRKKKIIISVDCGRTTVGRLHAAGNFRDGKLYSPLI